jgi:predicted enzyme related to lactoylglutathione lyase
VTAFCWHDLAAADAPAARRFYGSVFGWSAAVQRANGGCFLRLRSGRRDVGSLYPLSRAQLAAGVPSHWTSYVRVDDVDAAARRAQDAGGRVLVTPFAVDGTAVIAVIADPAGAMLGLWQDLPHV